MSLINGHTKVQSSFSSILPAHRLEQDFAWALCVAAGKTCGVGILPRFIRFVEGGGFVFSCAKSKEDVLLNAEDRNAWAHPSCLPGRPVVLQSAF